MFRISLKLFLQNDLENRKNSQRILVRWDEKEDSFLNEWIVRLDLRSPSNFCGFFDFY